MVAGLLMCEMTNKETQLGLFMSRRSVAFPSLVVYTHACDRAKYVEFLIAKEKFSLRTVLYIHTYLLSVVLYAIFQAAQSLDPAIVRLSFGTGAVQQQQQRISCR